MKCNFLPVVHNFDSNVLSEINAAEAELFFQKLIALWVGSGYGRSIRIGGFQEGQVDFPVMFALEEHGAPVAIAQISRRELKSAFGDFQPLPEKVYSFADQEGFTNEQEWFDERNNRLRIVFNEKLDEFVAPASAIPELLLGYCFSSCGEITICSELIEDSNFSIVDIFRIQLTFHGDETARGWQESYAVLESRLNAFLKKDFAPKTKSRKKSADSQSVTHCAKN